jgi:hypothetical protein
MLDGALAPWNKSTYDGLTVWIVVVIVKVCDTVVVLVTRPMLEKAE